jgi:hypothetical protein
MEPKKIDENFNRSEFLKIKAKSSENLVNLELLKKNALLKNLYNH